MKTFLVESYVPELDEATAARTANSVSAATRELGRRGAAIELLQSFALLSEDTCFSLFSAASAADVRSAAGLARVACDQLSEVVCHSPD